MLACAIMCTLRVTLSYVSMITRAGTSQVVSFLFLTSVTLLVISLFGRILGPLVLSARSSLRPTVTLSSSGRAPARLVRVAFVHLIREQCPKKICAGMMLVLKVRLAKASGRCPSFKPRGVPVRTSDQPLGLPTT